MISLVSDESIPLDLRMAAHNMYRIGDFVYVDVGPTEPYAVRRIDELQKAATGNVEVEVSTGLASLKCPLMWLLDLL